VLGDGDHDPDDKEPGPVASPTSVAGGPGRGCRSSMPAFRSVVSVLSREPRETLLYTLKAGPTVTGEPAPPHTQVDPTDVYALTDEDAYLEAGGDEKPAIVAEPMPDLFAPRVCLFCKKAAEHLFGEQYPKTDKNFAIIDGVWICDECVARFARLLAQENPDCLAQGEPGNSVVA
jgi:hypothetical protein